MFIRKQMPKKLPCLFCDNLFENFEDLMHHLELDHVGMDSKVLDEATTARETKKQLGNYVDINKNGVGVECPHCFEIFSGLDNLIKHAKKEHNKELDSQFLKKLKELIVNNPNAPPICNICNTRYLGLITTKINNEVQNICFNCYEKYFGTNALTKITIGTPDDIIKRMRIPL